MKTQTKKSVAHYEHQIWSNYGRGSYEFTVACDDKEAAKRDLKTYRQNQPQFTHILKKVWVTEAE